jgi:hypothetical protein
MSTALQSPEPDDFEFTPLEFSEFAIRHKGSELDMSRRPWLHPIYDLVCTPMADGTFRRKVFLVFGRQSEKSTTIGNLLLSLSNLIPYLRMLYVTASNEQMREFSDERLRAIILDSPILQRLAGQTGAQTRQTQNVQTKRWVNLSKILLRSVFKSPDRVRGIPADFLGVDEIQDVYIDYLPVIEEVLTNSELDGGPISIYSGTPKTFDNALEFYWSRHSTQNEWMTKCPKCNHWNIIEYDNVGPEGLICTKPDGEGFCGGPLDPVDGQSQWITTGRAGSEWESFRLPQPIVPYAYRNRPDIFKRRWQELNNKRKRYNRPKFYNEVMARSFDQGTKPVSFEEVRRCCLNNLKIIEEPDKNLKHGKCWAGLDWGTGDASFTVLSIWNYDSEGRFRMLFAKRYEGVESDPDFAVADIIKWCRKYNVTRIGSDWGFGFQSNAQLAKAFGAAKLMCYFHAGKQKDKVKWDKKAYMFITHRTRVLQDVFTLIKRGPTGGGIAFVNWDEAEDFVKDILAVFSEYDERSRQIKFDHARGNPDDFLHTICYALLVSQFDYRRPDLHAPGTGQKFTM